MLIYLTVDGAGLKQLFVSSLVGDLAVIHNQDQVGILHRGDALRNNDLGCGGNVGLKAGANERIGLGIYRTGRVVENENFGLLKQRTCNAKALLLSTGDVGASLLDHAIVAIGEGANKLVCLRQAASLFNLLVGCIGVTPTQIILNAARKQKVLLQNDRYAVAQTLNRILTHVNTANLYRALGNVIQTRNELNKCGFTRTRTANDTNGHARFNMQIDIGERKLLRMRRILKVNALKIDGAILYFGNGVFGIVHIGNLVKHLAHTLCGLCGNGEHNVDHGKHHQGHQNLHAVCQECGNLTDLYTANAIDCHKGTKQKNDRHVEIHAEVHQGGVERYDTLRTGKVLANGVCSICKLLFFVFFARKSLNNTHTAYIFFNRLVESVVFFEHALECGHCLAADQIQATAQNGNDNYKGYGKPTAHVSRHCNREDQH